MCTSIHIHIWMYTHKHINTYTLPNSASHRLEDWIVVFLFVYSFFLSLDTISAATWAFINNYRPCPWRKVTAYVTGLLAGMTIFWIVTSALLFGSKTHETMDPRNWEFPRNLILGKGKDWILMPHPHPRLWRGELVFWKEIHTVLATRQPILQDEMRWEPS